MYGKKERSGGGKSVAEGKGRSRRFGAASPATGFGMIPRFVRPPSKKRLRPSSPVALESECDDVPRPLGQEAVLRRSRERGAPLEDHRGEHSRRTEHRTGRRPPMRSRGRTRPSIPGEALWRGRRRAWRRRRARALREAPSEQRRLLHWSRRCPSAMAHRAAPAPPWRERSGAVPFRSGPGRAAGSAAPAGKTRWRVRRSTPHR